jgi:hypothetical protein
MKRRRVAVRRGDSLPAIFGTVRAGKEDHESWKRLKSPLVSNSQSMADVVEM